MSPAPTRLTVTDPAIIKIFAHPLRTRMLEEFEGDPKTIREVAESIGKAPDRLYYHLRQLVDAGLLVMDSESVVDGKVDRRYRLAADAIEVRNEGGPASRAAGQSMIDNVFERARREIGQAIAQRSGDERDRTIALQLAHLRLTESRAEELRTRLHEVITEFADEHDDAAQSEKQGWGLLLAHYRLADGA